MKIQLWATLGIFRPHICGRCYYQHGSPVQCRRAQPKRYESDNLLLMQRDSLETVYDNRELALLDSLEDILFRRAQEMHTENENLKNDLKRERRKSADLEKERIPGKSHSKIAPKRWISKRWKLPNYTT